MQVAIDARWDHPLQPHLHTRVLPPLVDHRQVEVSDGDANGVLLNLGGHGEGWSFYLKDGRPTYCYNLLGQGGRAG